MTHFDMMQFEFTLAWMLIIAVVLVVPFWTIASKSGRPAWLAVLVLVPGINVLFLYYLAFSRWKRKPDVR